MALQKRFNDSPKIIRGLLMDHSHRINWLSEMGTDHTVSQNRDTPLKTKRLVGRTDQDLSRLLCGNVERGLRSSGGMAQSGRRRGPLKRVQLTISGCVGAAAAKMQESWDKNSLQICADCPLW
jgi:hypothetical protein